MLFADSGIKEEINKITRNPQKLWKSNESFYVVIGSKKKSQEKLESVWIASTTYTTDICGMQLVV